MGTTLLINPGSSSKKYALYRGTDPVMALRFEQTGHGYSVCSELKGTKGLCREVSASEFQNALSIVLDEAVKEKHIAAATAVARVGVRVVAPASYFTKHRLIDDEYVDRLSALLPVAPLHIPSMLTEIERVKALIPEAEHIGVSDSAFHSTADKAILATSIPFEDAEQFDLHRFGYHGISVASIVKHLVQKEGDVPERLVVCHIGSGVSVTGVQAGKSIGNSMGYSPASGVMMGSRMGDVPADLLAAAIVRKGLKGNAIFEYLFNEGGFKGVAGVKDLRLVLDRAEKNDMDAIQALQMFAHQVKSLIASFAMHMGGLDMIVLTATAAERNPVVRSLLVGELLALRTVLDETKNEALINSEGYIQTDDSDVKILVLKTDELGEMYRIVSQF